MYRARKPASVSITSVFGPWALCLFSCKISQHHYALRSGWFILPRADLGSPAALTLQVRSRNAKLSPVLLGTTGNAEHFQRAFSFAEDLISLRESFRFHLNLGSNQVTARVTCCISFESTCPAESRGSGNICWGCGLPPTRSWIDHRSPPVNSFPDPDSNHFLLIAAPSIIYIWIVPGLTVYLVSPYCEGIFWYPFPARY